MLTLCMVLTLLPAGGMTVKAATTEVYVGGVNVVDNDPKKTTFWVNDSGSITNNGADENNYNVKYDPSTETLYLKEAIIDSTYSDTRDYVYGIYCNGGMQNIVLEGDNTIAPSGSTDGFGYGIYVANRNLTISGVGKLIVSGVKSNKYNSFGICMGENSSSLTIINCIIEATGGAAEKNSIGVYLYSNGRLTISSGGKLTATGNSGQGSYGVSCGNVNINGGSLTAIGGTATTSIGSYGVSASNSLEISGGTLIAQSGTAATSQALNKAPTKPSSNLKVFVGSDASNSNSFPFDDLNNETVKAYKYIKIRPETFTITLDYNDGSSTKTTQSTNENDMLTNLPTPSRSGYDFIGWFTRPSNGEKVDESFTFDADTTIYAQWSEQSGGGSEGGGSEGGGSEGGGSEGGGSEGGDPGSNPGTDPTPSPSSSNSDDSRDSSTSYTTGVVASGSINGSIDVFVLTPSATGSANEVVDSETYNQLRQSVESGYTPIAAFEVKASHSGKLTLSFPIGEQYNGMQFVVKHKTSSGTIETYTGVVENGKVVITVSSLSPFMVAVKGANKNPNTGR